MSFEYKQKPRSIVTIRVVFFMIKSKINEIMNSKLQVVVHHQQYYFRLEDIQHSTFLVYYLLSLFLLSLSLKKTSCL